MKQVTNDESFKLAQILLFNAYIKLYKDCDLEPKKIFLFQKINFIFYVRRRRE
jgi:hypothetical protein